MLSRLFSFSCDYVVEFSFFFFWFASHTQDNVSFNVYFFALLTKKKKKKRELGYRNALTVRNTNSYKYTITFKIQLNKSHGQV